MTNYLFRREFGSRNGELHHRSGGSFKLVSKGYLTKDGSLFHGNGAWLSAWEFRIECVPLSLARVSLPVSRLITQTMRLAVRALEAPKRRAEAVVAQPQLIAERDSRLSA